MEQVADKFLIGRSCEQAREGVSRDSQKHPSVFKRISVNLQCKQGSEAIHEVRVNAEMFLIHQVQSRADPNRFNGVSAN